MVLQEFFNICLMKSLQLLDLCFILLSHASIAAVISNEFSYSRCYDSHVKLGENASILCKGTKEITVVKVIFCFHHNDSCPDKISIDTEKKNYTAENGRISLKNSSSVYYLKINNVRISDHRLYKFYLKSHGGYNTSYVHLKITAPYTIDEVRQLNDTTIVCRASGGFPKSQLYWFDKSGNNLTHRSKPEARVAKDGSFFLTSTLQVELPVGEISYCCSFNSATCSDTYSVWTASQITRSDTLKSEEQTATPFISIPILVFAISAAVFCYLYRRKKGGFDAYWPRVIKVLPNQREQVQQEAHHDRMLPDQVSVTSIAEDPNIKTIT